MVQRDGSVLRIERVKLDDMVTEEEMQREYKKAGIKAEFNYYMKPSRWVSEVEEPNDPAYPDQRWYLEMINVPKAWEEVEGHRVRKARVAVIDTGVKDVIDLQGQLVAAYGVGGSLENPSDVDGHGTFIGGEIAAIRGNAFGVAGVADSSILSYRTYDLVDGQLRGTVFAMTQAIIQASSEQRVDVISISSSAGLECQGYMKQAIYFAEANQTVVVVSAGNDGLPLVNSAPGNCPNVIPVVAVNRQARRPYWTNYQVGAGDYALSAPGDRITGLNLDESPTSSRVTTMTGTSMAAPMVSGGASMVKSIKPELSAQAIRTILYQTGQESSDLKRGRLLNVAKAIQLVKVFFGEWFVPVVRKSVS